MAREQGFLTGCFPCTQQSSILEGLVQSPGFVPGVEHIPHYRDLRVVESEWDLRREDLGSG